MKTLHIRTAFRSLTAVMRYRLRRPRLWLWPTAVLLLSSTLPVLQAQTVSTDQRAYPPFATVLITGTGFAPGETVSNQVVQIAGPAPGTAYAPWEVVADANGSFSTSWYLFTETLGGTTLQLTSTGESSGRSAQTTFTDAVNLNFKGVGGSDHHNEVQSQDLGTVPEGTMLILGCPTNGLLVFAEGLNTSQGETVNWNVLFVPGYSNNNVLSNVTTLSPSSGTLSDNGQSKGTCISMIVDTTTLTPGTTYYGELLVTNTDTSDTYFFHFTVGPPVLSLTCPANVVTNTADAICGQVVGNIDPTYSPPGATLTYSLSGATTGSGSGSASGLTFNKGVTIVQYTITLDGSSASCSFTVTVNDTVPPFIVTCSPPQTAGANGACQATVPNFTTSLVATDNCTAPISLVITQAPPAGTLVGLGVTNITLYVVDAAGNISTCTSTFTVRDTNGPALTCPANIVTNTFPDQCSTPVAFAATATDNCSSLVTISYDIGGTPITSPHVFPLGITTVHVTATDAAQNTSECSFTVTVNDMVPPFIVTCSPPQAAGANDTCQAAVPNFTTSLVATDNCTKAISLVITQAPPAGTLVGLGVTNITLYVVDTFGNISTCTSTFTVSDTNAPTILCPANIVTNPPFCQCSVSVPFAATATDNCTTLVGITYDIGGTPITSPHVFPFGTTTVHATATDGAGNSSDCSFTVTVVTVVTNGLVGWWPFDETSGTTAVDATGHGHNATLFNGATWTSGVICGAVLADGINDYVRIPNIDLSYTNKVSVAFWVRHTYKVGGTHVLVENSPDYNSSTTGFAICPEDPICGDAIKVGLRGDAGYSVNCYDPPTNCFTDNLSPAPRTDGDHLEEWHHLVAIYDKSQGAGGEVTFYIDGVPQTPVNYLAANNANPFGDNPIYLFARAGTTLFTPAAMDDLRLYDRALTSAEVQQLYNLCPLCRLGAGTVPNTTPGASGVPTQGLVGYWPFDETGGTAAADASGHGYTATLFGGVNWAPGKVGGAVLADGSNGFVRLPPIDLSGTRVVSLSLWVNRNYSTVGGHTLVENSANFNNSTTGFALFPDDKNCGGILLGVRGDAGYNVSCYAQPSSGAWHHLVVIYDKRPLGPDELTCYIDGVLQPSLQHYLVFNNLNSFGNNPTFLFSRGGTAEFNAGLIDELRLYNRALSSAEVQQLYSWTNSPASHAGPPVAMAVSPDQRLRLTLPDTLGAPCRIETSTDLIHWSALTNVPAGTGTVQLLEVPGTNAGARFYRAVWTP